VFELTGGLKETGTLRLRLHGGRLHGSCSKEERSAPRTILCLFDLEQSKNAVLNSLAAVSSEESFSHAMEEFINWYSSEPLVQN
jgi:hypothetical protein